MNDDTAGSELAGTEPAGSELAGSELAGTEPADTEPADTELAASLGRLLRRLDPMPPAVHEAALASLSWRDPDAELARLVNDELLGAGTGAPGGPVQVRGTPPRLLTFQAGEVVIEMEITEETGGLHLVGQVVPPAALTLSSRGRTRPVAADALGRFSVAGVPAGPVRLCVEVSRDSGPARVCTEWVVL